MTPALVIACCGLQVGLLHGDPLDTRTPFVRASLLPTDAVGGWVPPPLPSVPYVRAAVGVGNGFPVLGRRLIAEELLPPRLFPHVGKAQIWQFTYECQVITPTGTKTVYIDRTALIIGR